MAVALAFLRLHEREILKGNDIADVVNALELSQGAMYEVDILLLQVPMSYTRTHDICHCCTMKLLLQMMATVAVVLVARCVGFK